MRKRYLIGVLAGLGARRRRLWRRRRCNSGHDGRPGDHGRTGHDSGDPATHRRARRPPPRRPMTVPSRIISLSPTATEMLYAIGAGDQVLAVDDFSNYPEEAAAKMQGLSGFEPNVEAIAGLEPDLVVTDGTNADLLSQFDTLGIAHWEGPAAVTFDDIYAQIEQLGAATGHVAEAAELVGQMQTDIATVIDGLPDLPEPLTYYHELDPNGYWSVTSDTFIGLVYTEAGLENIADAVGDGNPYPQLNAEFIVSADPDLIFLACTKYCGETPETVAARPGWGDDERRQERQRDPDGRRHRLALGTAHRRLHRAGRGSRQPRRRSPRRVTAP